MSGVTGLVVDALVKSGVLILLCFLGLVALRRASASARHLLLVATLAGLVALPVLTLLLPRWQVPYWERRAPVEFARSIPTLDSSLTTVPAAPAPPPLPWWVSAWILGSAIVGFRVLGGLIAIRRVSRTSTVLPEGPLRDQVIAHLEGHQVKILIGEADRPPMTWGWLRPVLLLPSDFGTWSEPQMRSVVLHEVAHIDRGDWLTQLGSRLICAVYWFHPGIWLIANQMEQESERAADDRVLTNGCRPEEYASHLLNVARSVRAGRTATAVAMARKSPVADRLEAVLAARRARAPLTPTGKFALAAAVAGLFVTVSAAGPSLIRSPQPPAPTHAPLRLASLGPDVEVTARPVFTTQGATGEPSNDSSACNSQADSNDDQADQAGASSVSSSESSSDDQTAPDQPEDAQPSDTPQVQAKSGWTARTERKIAQGVRNSVSMSKSALATASQQTDEAMRAANTEIKQAEKEIRNSLKDVNIAGFVQNIPEVAVNIPAIQIDTQNEHVNVPAIHVRVPAFHIQIPNIHIKAPMPSPTPKPAPADGADPSN